MQLCKVQTKILQYLKIISGTAANTTTEIT